MSREGVVATCAGCDERHELTVEQAIDFGRRGGRCPACTEEAELYGREERFVSPPAYPEAVLYVVGRRG